MSTVLPNFKKKSRICRMKEYKYKKKEMKE